MMYHKRHFFKLIQIKDEIYGHRRQIKNKCRNNPERYGYTPHDYRIKDEAEACIASRTEYTAYKYGVYRGACKRHTVNIEKKFHIARSFRCKHGDFIHERTQQQNHDAAQDTGKHGNLPQA